MNPYREHRILLLLQHRLGACEVKHGLERARELAALSETERGSVVPGGLRELGLTRREEMPGNDPAKRASVSLSAEQLELT